MSQLTAAEQAIIKYPTWYIVQKGEKPEVVLFESVNKPPVRMPDEFQWFLDAAIEGIGRVIEQGDYDMKGFAINIGNLRARCQESEGADGSATFGLRIAKDDVRPFDKLGLSQEIMDAIMNPDMQRTGGLIPIFGSQGCGKTSTAYSVLIEYLNRFGGSAYTIEDPIECSIQGWHGDKGGYLTQSDCTRIGYGRAVENSLRFARSILFVGEIREPKAAAEMLRISIGGQLVITTMHAKDHISMCQRLISLAHDGGEPQARSLLANALQLSIRQEIKHDVLQASMLEAANHNDVKSAIEKADYLALQAAVEKQTAMREKGRAGMGSPAPRPGGFGFGSRS